VPLGGPRDDAASTLVVSLTVFDRAEAVAPVVTWDATAALETRKTSSLPRWQTSK
jgi:hypothetical protein